jgi:hypothetical protein
MKKNIEALLDGNKKVDLEVNRENEVYIYVFYIKVANKLLKMRQNLNISEWW